MANQFYVKGKDNFAKGAIAWKAAGGSTIRALLCDSATYSLNSATHEFLSDIPAAALKGTNGGSTYTDGVPLTLIDPTLGGVLDANDISFTGIPAGSTLEYIILYRQGTSAADSHLLMCIDSATSGLPVTPDGNDILITWDNGPNKIGKL